MAATGCARSSRARRRSSPRRGCAPRTDILAAALELRRELQAARKADAQGAAADPLQKLPQFLRPIYASEVTARLQQAVTSERPFIERLTQFWTNHFAVSVDKKFLAGLAGSFEREAIRPHVLGNFADLLLAVETHPAMLLYLDNYLSVGPHAPAARAPHAATRSAGSASTRTWRARSSSCTRSASAAATRRPTSPPSRR